MVMLGCAIRRRAGHWKPLGHFDQTLQRIAFAFTKRFNLNLQRTIQWKIYGSIRHNYLAVKMRFQHGHL